MVEKTEKIWFNGKFVPWDEATIHVLTHTLHYGLGVFEGIRAYKTEKGTAVFRLDEHIKRFVNSAHIFDIDLPYTYDELMKASIETMRINKLKEGYIRPIAFIGYGDMGLYPQSNPIEVAIAVWPWGAYLGKEALEKGVKVRVSSYSRSSVNAMMTKAKSCGGYVNSQLAKWEAVRTGYDEAIMLDNEGYVSEGSGECVFIVRNGIIKTTSLTSILEGITRNSIIEVTKTLGYEVNCEKFTRDEMYISDEAFFTGTAAEITPIREIDGKTVGIGRRGPITEKLQSIFFDIARGKKKEFERWLFYV
ncbi:MAG: branched-chain amino acid transaminase [Campylobacterota bacterium]|nr:branched-chain amino acid transaminase [Campylobacterota bacterium]